MKKILVVEDSQTCRYLIQFMLTQEGYTVIEANNGEEGVELALQEKPDLVLMDIQLPGIDGMEAARRIRTAGQDIPIVALTASVLPETREIISAAGITGYIEKPLDPDTILDEITAYL